MICKTCGKHFENLRNLNARVCSRKCNAVLVTKEKIEKLKNNYKPKSCILCGNQIPFENRKNKKFCSKKCQWLHFRGAGNTQWTGGRKKHSEGYIYRYSPNHPHNTCGYVLEHRLVMEGLICRLLEPQEVVHHINGIKDDNRPENLELLTNQNEHLVKNHINQNGWFGRKRERVCPLGNKRV